MNILNYGLEFSGKKYKAGNGYLKENIDLSPFSHNDPIKCQDCLFRLIASLLVSGKIKIKLIHYNDDNFWSKKSIVLKVDNIKNHGALWHSSKIKLLKTYFEVNGFKTINESQMFFGRCDLGIPELKIFVEVGTINIYKLYLNLLKMQDGKIILVTSNNASLEFSF